jgi:outer membrane biosynthesis protein TonB
VEANSGAVQADGAALFTFFTELDDPEPWQRRWRIWATIILLALLAHVLFMATDIDWTTASKPAPVELKTIDPAKLNEIRNKWRNNQQKQLLIDTEKNTPSAKEASDKAKFMSDRNIVVEKEQRAKQTDVMPKAGAPGAATTESSEQKKKTSPRTVTKSAPPKKATQSDIPLLKDLGIPLNLSAKTHPEEEEAPPQNSPNQANPSRSGGGGANQWVDDQTMPEGSENLLNAQESVYYSFYSRLYEAIAPVWSSKVQEAAYAARVQAGDYTTVVDVVLNKEGDLVEVRQLKSSGVREFDSVVEPSWRKIGRFPNPPSGLLGSDGNLHMAWSFTMRVGEGGVSFLPPSRAN